jgi:hypothetical protein
MATFTDAPWDGAASNYGSTQAYCDACLINENDGDPKTWVQAKCHLPVKTPDGTYSKAAIRNALARINQVQSPGKAAALAKLHALAKAAKIGQ